MKTAAHVWDELCTRSGAAAEVAASCYHRLVTHYAEKHRAYHTLTHVEALLRHIEAEGQNLPRPDELRWAAFYHDLIYNPRRQDNEEQSALIAMQELPALGLSPGATDRVCDMIRRTAGHLGETATPEARLFLDLDLSILAAAPEAYDAYAAAIRQEYRYVPWFLYRKGRKKVLRYFLARPEIYFTPALYSRWDAAARTNLLRELHSLGG